MDLLTLGRAILYKVLYTAVLTHSVVSGQNCTNQTVDPVDVELYNPDRLVPLLGRHESSGPELWIFPALQFTCYGTLTKWNFRGVPGQAMPCSAELGTWRLDTTNTVYERLSTTGTNTAGLTRVGPIFTYNLASPVAIQPGDIVGVELGFSCSLSKNFDNVLSLNISGQGSSFLSYRRQMFGSSFFLQLSSLIPEQDYIPLIEAVVEPSLESTIATARVTTTPEADLSGEKATITITAVVFGSIMGVIIIIIVCICVGCITRRVIIQINCNKERRQSDADKQQQNDSNVIPVQQNAAYRQMPHSRESMDCQTTMEIPELSVQLNQAYGLRCERHGGTQEESTAGEEYVRMYATNRHRGFGPTVPREYESPLQQHVPNVEDTEHSYEYII